MGGRERRTGLQARHKPRLDGPGDPFFDSRPRTYLEVTDVASKGELSLQSFITNGTN